jgi:hypothetical protein
MKNPPEEPAPVQSPPVQNHRMTIVSENQESVIDIVKKYIESHSQFSIKREDYIFIEVLFNKFEDWFHCVNPNTPTPISKSQFSKIIARIPEFKVMRIAIGPRIGNVTPRKVGLVNRKFISS